ncbi:mRNA-capping enzyme [Drosophila grimshawi]|uniref:mRNA-capping enzyme n=1 Tax=Drosophila grimshawi TaxID=7222 RepID=B4JJ11_DROGR|nr:mRNA-capping enzyme [Drosophila grimshawi]EDW00552.1 GH11798 [Drosophila grimshawi]
MAHSHRERERGSGPLPNRWLYCPRKSDKIIAERFLAFKTPLNQSFEDKMAIECTFSPEMLFDYCKTLKLKLGLWIDLTNTKRFYDRSTVEERGAQYIKLQCRGHGETPSPEQTRSFIELVDNFINERPFDVIAVHCTHGFNRTGFLIVSYMVERLDCSVEAALAVFANARPPGIYKQDYINELFRRYEVEEDAPQAPEQPNWCLEYDDSNGNEDAISDSKASKRRYDDSCSSTSQQAAAAGAAGSGTATEDEDNDDDTVSNANGEDVASAGDGPQKKKRRRELVVKNAAFMAGVPGVRQITDQPRLTGLQHRVQDWCHWQKSGFPGAQPISMDKHNIKRLSEMPYRVSWKADGTRYMMLIDGREEIYFFDRNHSCFQVENMTFVHGKNLHEHLDGTLLDGEMVLDKIGDTVTPRFLVYDIVRLAGRDVREEFFYPHRLDYIKNEVIGPRILAMKQGIINRALEPFSVRNKDFWDIRTSESLLGEKFSRSLAHEPDGLIFQPSQQPYTAGVCVDVFKWKPHELNSVDFRLKIITERGEGLLTKKVGFLYVGGHDAPFGRMQKLTKEIRELDNKIVECTMNQYGNWDFMRERTDKKLPNSFNTSVAVVESIKHPITKDYLLSFIVNFGFRDGHTMMPPPASQRR